MGRVFMNLRDVPIHPPERAREAVRGAPLPHRARIERSFGRDLSSVETCVDAAATHRLGANAFASGNRIAFAEPPSLRLAAHEAAHVVGESREHAANAIAARVVSGHSASDLLPASANDQTSVHFEKAKPPTQQDLDEYFSAFIDHWEEEATTRPIGPERAEARRIVLLLSLPPNFATYDEADAFLAVCLELAQDEDKTVEQLRKAPSVDLDFFIANGDAFPNWWANRVNSELYGTSNEGMLERDYQAARKEALVNTALLSNEIWDRGLPITKEQAASLRRGSIPDLALSFENARNYPDERVGKYARLAITWERSLAHLMLVRWFRFQLQVRLDLIRKGEFVIDQDTWNNVLAAKFFNLKLRMFESAAARPEDMRATFTALMVQLPSRFFRDPQGSGIKYDFRNEAVEAFWKEIYEVDAEIAATSTVGRVWQAWTWAYERGYFSEAAREMYESAKEEWPWMLARMIGVFVAQAIPGVNIAVDVLLLIELGVDGVTAFFDLVDLIEIATNATNVEDLEHASAKMATAFAGIALKVVKWALTAGGRWTAKQWLKYRDGQKFLDEHGDTPENRKLLARANGDAKEARKLLDERRVREKAAREKAAAEAKRAEEKKQHDRDEANRQKREQDEREQGQRQNREKEPETFTNQYPHDPIGVPIQLFKPSQVMQPTFNRRLNYVVTEDGTLILGRKRDELGGGHIDLAQGAPVRVAGEVHIVDGKIRYLDNTSGHYLPKGPRARREAEAAFSKAGLEATGKYIEKVWNGRKWVPR